jgi:hypothetical protein
MAADSERLGWRWLIAAVDGDGQVRLLDPTRAARGKEVRVGESAAIPNLSKWL